MTGLATRLRQSVFAQGILSISIGTMIGQGISILVSPILTRLYTPAAMGAWGLFVSFVGVATVGGALRYELAIVAAKEKKDAQALAGYALILSILVSLIGGVVFEVFRRYGILGYEVFPWWMCGIATSAIVINVWGQVFRFWFIREKKFQEVGYFVAGRGVFRSIAQVSLSLWQGTGLILGEVFGRLISLGILLRRFPFREALRTALSWQSSKTLKKFKEYPLLFLPSAFIDTLALMAPVPVFTTVYGIDIGGMLALAQRVVSVPLLLLGNAVADVFFGEVADVARHHPEKARALFLKSTFRLGGFAFLLGIGLWWLAPWGVGVIFGNSWRFTGEMLRVMVPWFVTMLTVNPISRLIFLSRYPWTKLFYDVLALIGVALPLWLHLSEPLGALRFVAWVQAGLYVLYWFILFFAVEKGLKAK